MTDRGIVRDIRTGRAIGRTRSLTDTFLAQVQVLLDAGTEFYIVTGRCRTMEQRDLVTEIKGLNLIIIHDKQFPSDTLWLFEGDPDELGFAS